MGHRLELHTFWACLAVCLVGGETQDAPTAAPVTNRSGFEAVVNSMSFVDKTLFIKYFLDAKDSTVIVVPRGFGKTTNLDMLRRFLEIPCNDVERNATSRIFKDLKIDGVNVADHFMVYPVITIDFGKVNASSSQALTDSLWALILRQVARRQCYYDVYNKDCPYSWKSDRTTTRTPEARLHKLTVDLQMLTNKSSYLLVDNLDYPISAAIKKYQVSNYEIRQMAAQMKRFVGATHNIHSQFSIKSVFMATTPAVEGVYELREANPTLRVRRALEDPELSPFYGLTEKEMTHVVLDNPAPGFANGHECNLDELRLWFAGHHTNDGNVFCPYSVNRFTRTGEPKSYWGMKYLPWINETFPKALIGDVGNLLEDSFYKDPKLEPQKITIDDILGLRKYLTSLKVPRSTNSTKLSQIALQLLYDYGVFTSKSPPEISITNHDVQQELKWIVYTTPYLRQRYNARPKDIAAYLKALGRTTKNKTERFEDALRSINQLLTNCDVRSKQDMLVLLFYATTSRTYEDYATFVRQYSEVPFLEPGKKLSFIDIVFFSWRRTGIILELRYEEGSAVEALEEIMRKEYHKVFGQARYKKIIVKHKVYIGVHYSSKSNLTTLCYLYDSEKIEDAVNVTFPLKVRKKSKKKDDYDY